VYFVPFSSSALCAFPSTSIKLFFIFIYLS